MSRNSRTSDKHSLVELDEEFLSNDHKQTNLSVQFSDSVSVKSSSSGSSFQQFLETSSKQQDVLFYFFFYFFFSVFGPQQKF